MGIVTEKTFFNPEKSRRVAIGNQVKWRGSKGHVVSIGRKFVEILFYPGEEIKGRAKVDPFHPTLVWLGTDHQ